MTTLEIGLSTLERIPLVQRVLLFRTFDILKLSELGTVSSSWHETVHYYSSWLLPVPKSVRFRLNVHSLAGIRMPDDDDSSLSTTEQQFIHAYSIRLIKSFTKALKYCARHGVIWPLEQSFKIGQQERPLGNSPSSFANGPQSFLRELRLERFCDGSSGSGNILYEAMSGMQLETVGVLLGSCGFSALGGENLRFLSKFYERTRTESPRRDARSRSSPPGRSLSPTRDKRSSYVPLHLAVELGSIPMIDLLIRHGATIDIPTGVGHKLPLQVALESHRFEMADHLVTLAVADKKMQEEKEKRRKSPRRNDNEQQQQSSSTISLDDKENTLLMVAASQLARHRMTFSGHADHLKAREEKIINLLHRIITQLRIPVAAKNSSGEHLVSIICSRGSVEAARFLFNNESSEVRDAALSLVNVPTSFDLSPLTLACQSLSVPLVRMLLTAEIGADVQYRTPFGLTPLHFFCKDCGHIDSDFRACAAFRNILQLLVEKTGPEIVDAQTTDRGETALHYAVKSGAIHIIKELVQNFKADATIKDSETGADAVELARRLFGTGAVTESLGRAIACSPPRRGEDEK